MFDSRCEWASEKPVLNKSQCENKCQHTNHVHIYIRRRKKTAVFPECEKKWMLWSLLINVFAVAEAAAAHSISSSIYIAPHSMMRGNCAFNKNQEENWKFGIHAFYSYCVRHEPYRLPIYITLNSSHTHEHTHTLERMEHTLSTELRICQIPWISFIPIWCKAHSRILFYFIIFTFHKHLKLISVSCDVTLWANKSNSYSVSRSKCEMREDQNVQKTNQIKLRNSFVVIPFV